MTPTLRPRWSRKEFALILAIVTFVGAVVFLSISMARPKLLPNEKLGAEWQCRTSLFLTSCTRTPHAENMLHHPLKAAICLRQA